jgi:L-threonylcarbamoyladenylate synthase
MPRSAHVSIATGWVASLAVPIEQVPTDAHAVAAFQSGLASRLERGEIVVLPTDTVYGLVGVASLPTTFERLRDLKGRPDDMPVAVLTADPDAAFDLATRVSEGARRAARRWWPGALTLVLDAAPHAPRLAPDGSIGVRCPDHPLVRTLAERLGPLAATSANPHGVATPTTAVAAADLFPDLLVIDGEALAGAASTVIDCRCTPPEVLRAGALDPGELAEVLGVV